MPDSYADIMTRHDSDIQRLNNQFDIMSENIGYILHPTITATLPVNPSIADVATGTGVFLLRIRESYPEGDFLGLDISPAGFPEPTTLPDNVTLSIQDVKKPIPEELHGKYDAVHVRMLVAAMLPTDWKLVVANLKQMLKPGGYLQWLECDFVGTKHLRWRLDSSVDSIQILGRAFAATFQGRLQHGWNTLPAHMEAAGLCDVSRDIVSSDRLPETRERSTLNSTLAILSTLRLMAERKEPGAMTFEEIDALENRAYEDIKSGTYVRYDIHVIIGRKPF
ncbi:S-adenosyl-L-methionine-dependent methyltransferase [Xylaria nigripes]|nr:S-adenosyl-L-methionine-dependent methyltransferase [Xylaria nigripes]